MSPQLILFYRRLLTSLSVIDADLFPNCVVRKFTSAAISLSDKTASKAGMLMFSPAVSRRIPWMITCARLSAFAAPTVLL